MEKVFYNLIVTFVTTTKYLQLVSFLCRLKRRHIGTTFVGGAASAVAASAASSASSASGFPCPEHNFVTVGPNHSKLGMHVSMQCQATHLFQ